MIRKALWVIVVLLVAVLGLSLFTLGPDGGPLLRGRDFSSPAAFAERLESVWSHEDVHTVRRTYKWRGAGGEWVYSTEVPPPGIEYEVVETNPQTNVLPALITPEND